MQCNVECRKGFDHPSDEEGGTKMVIARESAKILWFILLMEEILHHLLSMKPY